DVDSLYLDTLQIRATRVDLIAPERQAGAIRLAVQEVDVMLPHKEAGGVDWLGAVDTFVVGNGQGCSCRSECRVRDIAQRDRERFVSFRINIVDYRNGDSLRCLSGGEGQLAERCQVVAT